MIAFPSLRARALRCAMAALGTLALHATHAQNVAINTTGAAAQPTALLDVSSLTKGIFLPRMATLPSPAGMPDGLTVYKTGSPHGFRVVYNNQWVGLLPGYDAWDIYGNYLKNPANPNPDFLGSTDNAPLYFRTNNLHRMRLDGTSGLLGVGYPAAAPASLERLDINGALRIFYTPPLGQQASKTDAPGVIRYQVYGTVAGSGQYRYGSAETMATNPNNSATNNAVLGINASYPLQYAGHWGNVNGKPLVQGVATPAVKQPDLGGWRALENPYNEVVNANWTHFREAVCGPGAVTFPNNFGSTIWNNTPAVPAAEQAFVSPFPCSNSLLFARRQYLFLKDELNLELAQEAGGTGTGGLCPGQPIDSVRFYVNPLVLRSAASVTTDNFSVTVRNAPAGLNALNGFDNTSDYGTLSCGAYPGGWPNGTVGTMAWMGVKLTPPFVWDGQSNVLIEVATKLGPPLVGTNPQGYSAVRCINTGFYATYAATFNNGLFGAPYTTPPAGPVPPASCNSVTNLATRMQDVNGPGPLYLSGKSMWRPIVRFVGTVATAGPSGAGYTMGTANYIHYPGALILEDTLLNAGGVPFGRWRTGIPAGTTFWGYQRPGSISAQHGVFDNGVKLNDHVFDRAFDGRVAPQDAALFGDQRQLTMDEMAAFTRINRHLPTMKGRQAWNAQQGFSLGDLSNQLWATTETQALYVADLHDKLNVIEMLTSDRPVSEKEFLMARRELAVMNGYTDAEKMRLIAALRKRAALTQPAR